MCQCAQRREIIVQAMSGQVTPAQAALVVVSTAAQDLRAGLAAAKARLARVGRR